MEEKLIEKPIIINGKEYTQNDVIKGRVVIDFITKEYILAICAHRVATQIKFDNTGRMLVHKFELTHSSNVETEKGNVIIVTIWPGTTVLVHTFHKVIGDPHPVFKLYKSVDPNSTIYYDFLMHQKINKANKFRAFNSIVSASKEVDNENVPLEDRKRLLEIDIFYGVRTLTNKIFEGLNYTYGIEIETSSGRVSQNEERNLNLMCEFDGSLRDTPDQKKEDVLGGEYVTGVLVGDAGMHQLNKICKVLSDNCTVNSKCGVHVHVGNIKFNKENIVHMYMLGLLLEEEIFSMFPKSRRDNTYCRKLTNVFKGVKPDLGNKTTLMYNIVIDELYNSIFKEVFAGYNPSKKWNKKANHPRGNKCGYDKTAQRYCWLNFVTAMCNTRGNNIYTLEFRIHHGTTDYIKIKHWLKICIAFVNFAENHQKSIRRKYHIDKDGNTLPINLNTIVNTAFPTRGRLVCNYIEERKALFAINSSKVEVNEYTKESNKTQELNKIECLL